jgi:hypothetical protein
MLQGRITTMGIAASKRRVNPNALNWANVSGASPTITTMLQVTGITVPITLRVAYSGDPYTQTHQYSVQSTASFGTGTAIANNGTFTVSNGQYLGFSVSSFSTSQVTNWTITNVSSNNAVIDTFQTVTSGGGAAEE